VEWKSATKEEVANMKKQQIEGGEVVNMKVIFIFFVEFI
jgi:hypothetical protein